MCVIGIASIMVLVAGITTYDGFMSESTTSHVTQNTASEGPNGDGDGETNDDYIASEGQNGDGDGETNDNSVSQH